MRIALASLSSSSRHSNAKVEEGISMVESKKERTVVSVVRKEGCYTFISRGVWLARRCVAAAHK
jgi:hypothetical protein